MDDYPGKKYFTICHGDVGTEAYRDEYVKWLEQRVAELESDIDYLFDNERLG